MGTKAFEFVELHDLPSKPRSSGIIEIRGPYYASVTYGYLRDLLEDWGEYVDGYKFAGGSMRLLARDKVKNGGAFRAAIPKINLGKAGVPAIA